MGVLLDLEFGMAADPNYPPTPALDAIKSVQPFSQKIGEFMDWLREEKHFHLGAYHEHTNECYTMGLEPAEFRRRYVATTTGREQVNARFSCPQCGLNTDQLLATHFSIRQLLAEFFNIDEAAAERERQSILEHIRTQP